MRTFILTLAVLAGVAAPMAVPANATICNTYCNYNGTMCQTICF
jgi:hypothetical protein